MMYGLANHKHFNTLRPSISRTPTFTDYSCLSTLHFPPCMLHIPIITFPFIGSPKSISWTETRVSVYSIYYSIYYCKGQNSV